MSKKTFWLLIVLSFVVQIILSFYDTYSDVKFYTIPWAQSIVKFGMSGFFDRKVANMGAIYPPLALYILTFFYTLGQAMIKPILAFFWQLNILLPFFPSKLVLFLNKDNILYSFMKLPNILGNILLAVAVYKLMMELIKKKSRLPFLAFISILFNPVLIFLSAMWGQIDVIPYVFVVWSFYFLLKKRSMQSVVFFAVALLIKQTVLLAIPFYLIYFANRLNKKTLIKSAVLLYGFFAVAFWPFQKTIFEKLFPFISYAKLASKFGSDMASMHAHNFWGAVAPNMRDYNFRLLSQAVVGGFLAFMLFRLWKKRKDLLSVLSAFSLFSFFSFMFMTRMHERHLFVVIPFFLIASLIDFRYYWIFVFESFYLLLNMYAAWPVPRVEFFAKTLNYQPIVVTIVLIQMAVLWLAMRYNLRYEESPPRRSR